MSNTTEINDIKIKAVRGSVWIFVLTAIGFPLLYIRNWFLNNIETDTNVAGVFALLVLLQQGILTFLFFGGKNVITTFYPKLKISSEKTGFVNSYYIFVLAASILGVLAVISWPKAVEVLIREELTVQIKYLLIILIPVILLVNLGISFLTAMKDFGLAAFLGRTQLFFITFFIVLFYFIAPEALIQKPLLILGSVLLFISLASIIISQFKIHKKVGFSKIFHLPPNSIHFGIFAHFETIATYAYISMDQFFVLQKFDISKLGEYFLLLQLARIIPLSVQIFGHLILTTFSSLLGSDNQRQALSTYRKLSRLSIGFHFLISLVLVLFARQIAGIFGTNLAENNRYLIWLAVDMNIASMYTISSMYATSHEKMRQLFFAKLIHIIVQFAITLLLISPLHIYGIIAGRGIGVLIGNLSIFFIVSRIKPDRKEYPPYIFFISQVIIIPAAIYTHIYQQNLVLSLVIFSVIIMTFILIGKYRPKEVTSIVRLALKKNKADC